MANTLTPPVYPFDPQGTLPSNLIQGERQVISPPDWTDFYFIVPKATPYFAKSLKLVLQPSGKVLTEGVDYNPGHRFHDASLQCASDVYGSIVFLDRTLSGVVDMAYQTLGGDWTVDSVTIAQVLANVQDNPRTTTWEEVVNVPYQFPPIDHPWDVVDMTGAKDVVDALDRMTEALLQSGDKGLANHLADFNNPHRVTAAQVNLGNVPNLPMASTDDAVAGVSNAAFMSPALTASAINVQALKPLNDHINNTNNPHGVTAAQVSLGLVNNFGWASTQDAATGVATNGYMNAALTKAAIAAQAIAPLNAHLADTDNPHQVTAGQLGLGNVPNYPMATLTEALAGNATDRMMSPALVRQVMNGNLGGSLAAHIADHNNPHQVTAEQVNLGKVNNFPMATNDQAVAGSDTQSYMSPALTAAYTTQALGPLTQHISNLNNPHQTTAAQVNLGLVNNLGWASDEDASSGANLGGYMNAQLTKTAITAQVGNAFALHAGDFNNPHKVTADQIDAYTKEATDSAISTAVGSKLDKTAQAADSAKLEGKTLAQVIDSVPLPPTPLTARVLYDPLDDSANESWTPVATTEAGITPAAAQTPAPLSFYLAGGEGRHLTVTKPLYRVHLNPSDLGVGLVEQLAGHRGQLRIGVTYDSATDLLTVWVRAKASRNAMALLAVSDAVKAFQVANPVVTAEPAGIFYLDSIDVSAAGRSLNASPGSLPFGQLSVTSDVATPVKYDSMLHNFTVLESGESDTSAKTVATVYSQAFADYRRYSSVGPNLVTAAGNNRWSWVNGKGATVAGPSGSLDVAIAPQPVSGPYQIDAVLSSTAATDMAIGIVIGFTDRNGRPQALYAMRDMGGTTILGQNGGTRGIAVKPKLLTVGYNLFTDDAIDLGSTSAGLIWADGVADADRAGTPYVTAAAGGTNGWANRGFVKISATLTVTGGTPVVTIQTSNYGADSSNLPYVDAAKVTVDFSTLTGVELQDLVRAFDGEGLYYGVAAFRQANASIQPTRAPDMFTRYVQLGTNSDGTDATVLNFHNGNAWTTLPWMPFQAKPGRLVVSDFNQRLYQCSRDGSLRRVNIAGYTSGP